ncbi:BON domain-containing protein [Candidatus Nitrospira bockiana]
MQVGKVRITPRKALLVASALLIGSMSTPSWAARSYDDDTGRGQEREHRMRGGSPFPSHGRGYYEITAERGYLVGGEGRTGDSMRYEGREIWTGPSSALILVDERKNTGMVTGTVRTKGHTYTVLMNRFNGDKPFMSGGIAKDLYLHGVTGKEGPALPKVWTYLAGWGDDCTVYKDSEILYDDFTCHFMVTETVRDPSTHKIPNYPSREELEDLLRAKEEQGDTEAVADIKRQIREAGDSDRRGMQLHIIAHSPNRNLSNVPPYERAMHFMWDKVTWWSGPEGPRGAGAWQGDGRHGRGETDSDRKLKQRLERDIKYNYPFVDSDDVHIRVRDGVVVLTGTVDTPQEAEDLVEMAYDRGANKVVNKLIARAEDVPPGEHSGNFAPWGTSGDSGSFDYFR